MFKIIVFTSVLLFEFVDNSNNWRLCSPCRCFGDKKAECSQTKMNITLEDIPDFLSNEIEVLNITKHRIETLKNDVFFFNNLTNLWKLYLEKCSIKIIEKNAFKNLEQITDISLMYNEISEIDSTTFSSNTNLKYLWLDNNKIKKLSNNLFLGLTNLNGFYARFNQISIVENAVFSEHPDLWIIDFSNNKLEYLNASIIDNLKSVKVLFLQENMWSCDCRLKFLNQIMIERNLYNTTKTICTYPDYLKGKELKLLRDNDFKCWQNMIIFPEENRTIFEGTNITYSCIVSALPKPNFKWNFNSKNILKYTVNASMHDTIYFNNLTIINSTQNDTGVYSCQVNESNLNKSIYLTVLPIEKPELKIVGNYNQTILWNTRNFTLCCLVHGAPKPNKFWIFNNKSIESYLDKNLIISQDDYWLNITFIKLFNKSKGWYTCLANNTKYSSTKSVYLSISEPILPEVNILTGSTFKVGQNATISCYIKAYSTPEIFWKLKNDIKLNSKKYQVYQKLIGNNSYWLNLTIINITYQDIGNYSCTAKSIEGESKKMYLIKNLVEKPTIKIYPPIFHDFNVTIPSLIYSNPNENVCTWKMDKITKNSSVLNIKNISDNNFWCNITIFNITSQNSGRYYCQASNNVGLTEEYTDLKILDKKNRIFSPFWYIVFCSIIGCIFLIILIVICKLISNSNQSKNRAQISQKERNIKENQNFDDIPLENCGESSEKCTKTEEDIMYIIERDLKSYDVTTHKD